MERITGKAKNVTPDPDDDFNYQISAGIIADGNY